MALVLGEKVAQIGRYPDIAYRVLAEGTLVRDDDCTIPERWHDLYISAALRAPTLRHNASIEVNATQRRIRISARSAMGLQ